MGDLLEHLGKDTLPGAVVESFVEWCVWEQAQPALVTILKRTGLPTLVNEIRAARDLQSLASASEKIGNFIHEIRRETGPLGLSTAEAVSFLVSRLALAARKDDWDPEGVAFFAMQAVGWSAFAETSFTNPMQKPEAEKRARIAQETQLRALWHKHHQATAE
jgi:hypothetical protein